jgi:hypothetical protein
LSRGDAAIDRVRRALATSSGGSVSSRARSRRWQLFAQRFPDLAEIRVLDLGGTVQPWVAAPVQPRSVVVVNLDRQASSPPWITAVVGDACALPRSVAEMDFDLVYSNSVIEHVGGHLQRQAFADTVAGAADLHWVQTPYRYFPVEPHWVFPLLQFLPVAARAQVARRWRLGHRHVPREARREAVASVLGVELLSRVEMSYYFPASDLVVERYGGLVKSLISVKDS